MKKYKALIINPRGDLISPVQGFFYGYFDDLPTKFFSTDVDMSDEKIAKGFHAVDEGGILFAMSLSPRCVGDKNSKIGIFEVEVEGGDKIISSSYQRFERIKIIRHIRADELKYIVKKYSDTLRWDYYHMCFPDTSARGEPSNLKAEQGLLLKWDRCAMNACDSRFGNTWLRWNGLFNEIPETCADTELYSYLCTAVYNIIENTFIKNIADSRRASCRTFLHVYFASLAEDYDGVTWGHNMKEAFSVARRLWGLGFIPFHDEKTQSLGLYSKSNGNIVVDRDLMLFIHDATH